jgi:hypothetical protein
MLTRALELRQDYLDFIRLGRAPAEVILPGSVPFNLAVVDDARARGEETDSWISADGSVLINTIHVWAAYRETKTLYEIEPALAECLSRSPWPERTPMAALRLPSRCPVLSIPRGDNTIRIAATYDLVTRAAESGALELRISQYEDDLWVPICILDMREADLGVCVEAAARDARFWAKRFHDRPPGDLDSSWLTPKQIADGLHAEDLWKNTTAGLALTLLLYLGGDPDVVRVVHPGERPAVKPKLQRTDPERFKDIREPTTYAVGGIFARAVERWEFEHRNDPGIASGRSVRPHMRRAHSHLYWTGKGREIPRVRFLLPVSVRGSKLVEEPERPTETKVR